MYALGIVHRVERIIEPLFQRRPIDPDIHVDRFGAFKQAIHMLVKKGNPALMDTQTLPDPVAEHEAGIENRDHSVGARHQFAIDIDENFRISRIVLMIVRTFGHIAL